MISAPFLIQIKNSDLNYPNSEEYPFNVPIFSQNNFNLEIKKPILIISGDNGTGKSTLLETLATACDFNISGGNRNHLYDGQKNDVEKILNHMRLIWKIRVSDGFFMRADSFVQFTNYMDKQLEEFGGRAFYGGKLLNEQSHGESFLSLFENRFKKRGIYILDEPEAALSPQRILSFMTVIKDLADTGNAQFIISTHSPMLMALPDSQFIYITGNKMKEMDYKDTEHYRITKSFLDSPERYFKYLFDEQEK